MSHAWQCVQNGAAIPASCWQISWWHKTPGSRRVFWMEPSSCLSIIRETAHRCPTARIMRPPGSNCSSSRRRRLAATAVMMASKGGLPASPGWPVAMLQPRTDGAQIGAGHDPAGRRCVRWNAPREIKFGQYGGLVPTTGPVSPEISCAAICPLGSSSVIRATVSGWEMDDRGHDGQKRRRRQTRCAGAFPRTGDAR